MRRQGKIAEWNDERGFGFISAAEAGDNLFVHISSFPRSDRRPTLNEAVTYTLAFDPQGRPRAVEVRFVHSSYAPSIPRMVVAAPVAFALSFLFALAALQAVGWLEWSWLALYYVASIVTYACYSRDKTAAQTARRRTPELTLHLMSLIGGWPGALIAQALLRHKTRKPTFLVGYWLTVIVNCIVLGVIVRTGLSPLKLLIDLAS
jgi:uncharacterized membrane protein YsdA (DUF1294 family)/cold shock CspA family protein